MRVSKDTPIFSALIAEMHDRRQVAEEQAERSAALLADVQALHEPDRGGDCPTCGTPAPCSTFRLVRREIDLTTAHTEVARGSDDDTTGRRQVPRVAELIESSREGVDRLFGHLLG